MPFLYNQTKQNQKLWNVNKRKTQQYATALTLAAVKVCAASVLLTIVKKVNYQHAISLKKPKKHTTEQWNIIWKLQGDNIRLNLGVVPLKKYIGT